MFKFLVLLGLVVVFVVVLGLMSPRGDSPALAQQSQPPSERATTTQPVDNRPGAAPPGTHGVPGTPPVLPRDQIEKLISPEEREAMGLGEPTWVKEHGKVHPDVRAVLQTGQMPWLRFKGWAPCGFEGTAYVAVHLRHEQRGERSSKENQAPIREAQRRVLSKLTALEFSTVYTFKNTAGFVGYVNPAGLAKLEKDPDVVAVGLDDKPVPKDPPYVFHVSPPPQRDERGKMIPRKPPERIGKIEADVYAALQKSEDGYVYVGMALNLPIEWHAPSEEKELIAKRMQEAVLSALTAAEFRVKGRDLLGGMDGYVTVEGLAKLNDHADVWGVGLDLGPPQKLESGPRRP